MNDAITRGTLLAISVMMVLTFAGTVGAKEPGPIETALAISGADEHAYFEFSVTPMSTRDLETAEIKIVGSRPRGPSYSVDENAYFESMRRAMIEQKQEGTPRK